MNIVAILSTTILPLDGTYAVSTVDLDDGVRLTLSGVPNYIGHPATKTIVEGLGAAPAPSKLFAGLEPGESALCFAIAQGKSDRSAGGTAVNQEVTIDDLSVRLLTRIE